MDLLTQIMAALQGFATESSPLKAAAIITVLISIWKSSLLQPLWAKFGSAQILVAPLLGMISALITLPGGFSWANVMAGLHGGLLAIALHAVFTALEDWPVIGAPFQKWIAWVDQLLLAPAASSTTTPTNPPAAS